MVDVFLILFIIIWVVLALGITIKLLFFYMMPEDRTLTSSIFVKSVIVLALSLAWLVILVLPLDVRNAQAGIDATKLDIGWMWIGIFILIAIFLVFVIPATSFYTEVEDDDTNKQKWVTVLWQWLACVIITSIILSIFYFVANSVSVPTKVYTCPIGTDCTISSGTVAESWLQFNVNFQIFLIGVTSFFGWFVFVTFGGIGLTSLPLSYIFSFIDRPKPIDLGMYAEKKCLYGKTADSLLEEVARLSERDQNLQSESGWKATRKRQSLKSDFNKVKKTSLMLEEEFEKIEVAMKQRGENPVVSAFNLILGIVFAITSLMWLLHVIIFIIVPHISGSRPPTGFLNTMLLGIQGSEPGSADAKFIIAMVLYSWLNIHLLLCTISGCVKVGMKIVFLPIHPMRKSKTPLNSFLFNTVIILLAGCAIAQFSQNALSTYSRSSSAANIFQVQIKYLTFFQFFNRNEIFSYMIVIWAVLALIFLMVKPRNFPKLNLDGKADKAFSNALGQMQKKAAKAVVTGSVG